MHFVPSEISTERQSFKVFEQRRVEFPTAPGQNLGPRLHAPFELDNSGWVDRFTSGLRADAMRARCATATWPRRQSWFLGEEQQETLGRKL